MPAYVCLINYTEQGVRNVKNTADCYRSFEKVIESFKARKIGFWWTLGQHDLVAVVEAPDDETASKIVLRLGLEGNVRTTTLRAFSEDEFVAIVNGLG